MVKRRGEGGGCPTVVDLEIPGAARLICQSADIVVGVFLQIMCREYMLRITVVLEGLVINATGPHNSMIALFHQTEVEEDLTHTLG